MGGDGFTYSLFHFRYVMMRDMRGIGSCLAPSFLLVNIACGGGGDTGSGFVATFELEAEHPEPFSFLSGFRELPDGRLLAPDPLSQVLLRVDLDAGTADTLGGVGEGPGEY